MADQVKVEIVTVDAVSNLEELRKKIKEAKDNLATLNLGSKEYRDQLKQVIEGQNLLRAAMNGTTATAEHLKDAIDKEGTSYNSLVNQMANLKREFRAATTEAERADLGGRIKEINDQLKAMDAMKGDFQRNVGDYFNQTSKAMKEVIKDLPSGLNAIKGPMDDVEKSMSLMSKQPILGIIGLLAPLLTQIAGALKEDDAAMGAVKKAMDALKPLMDFFSGVLANIVDILGDIIGEATEFVQSNGIVQKVINGVSGVGNSIVQFLITPIKQTIVAVKGLGNIIKDAFSGKWDKVKEDARDAIRGINDAFTKGIDFKSNYDAGQKMAGNLIPGAKSRKKDARGAGTELGKEISDGIIAGMDESAIEKALSDIDKEIERQIDKTLSDIDKSTAEANKKAEERAKASISILEKNAKRQKEINGITIEDEDERAEKEYAIQEELNRKKLSLLEQYRDEALDRGDIEANLRYEQEVADLEVDIEMNALREKERLRKKDVEDARKATKAKLDTLSAYASGTSNLLSTVADALESGDEASEESVKTAKNLRIASATIDMISGAVTAFSVAQQLGPIAGPIVGAINAAAVVAAGLANISKIKATNVSKDSTPATASPETKDSGNAESVVAPTTIETGASTEKNLNAISVYAPTIPSFTPTTVTTGERTERAMDAISKPQKVYVLQSDIEAAGDANRVQVAESTF